MMARTKATRSRVCARHALGILALLFVLPACESLRLHDESLYTASKSIDEAYNKINLTEVLTTERKNLETLLTSEVAAVRENNRYIRDAVIFDLVRYGTLDDLRPFAADSTLKQISNSSSRPRSPLISRLHGIGVKNRAELTMGAGGARILTRRERAAKAVEREYQDLKTDYDWSPKNWNLPECAATMDSAPPIEVVAQVAANKKGDNEAAKDFKKDYTGYVDACQRFENESLDAIAKNLNGPVAKSAADDYQSAKINLDDLSSQMKSAKGDLDAKVKEYKDALEKAKSAESTAADLENLKGIAEKTRALLKGVKDGQKNLGGALIASDEQIAAMDTIIGAFIARKFDVASVSADNSGTGVARAATIAAAIPEIAEDLGILAGLTGQPAPNLGKLLMVKAKLESDRDYIAAQVDLAKRRLSLSEARLEAIYLELFYVNELALNMDDLDKTKPKSNYIRAILSGIKSKSQSKDAAETKKTSEKSKDNVGATASSQEQVKKSKNESTAEGKGKAGSSTSDFEVKTHLIMAIGSYASAIGIARANQDAIARQDIHFDHLSAVAADEYAITAWNAVTATPIDRIAAYHAGGIKPEKLAELVTQILNLGALATIAGRIN